VLLVIQCVVSFRSVPRILDTVCWSAGSGFGYWIPHFTSVINWTLRLGLGLLNQVAPVNVPWFAIIDHSIDIGTKKVLVVLRVPVDALSRRKSAIRLEDGECIGLTVCEEVNGERIANDLKEIFKRAGNPTAIIKDGDYTLQRGVRLWAQTQSVTIPVILDIGHAMATALKKQFEKDPTFQRFTKLVNQAAQRLRQTDLAFLIPPKLRSKGRFQSISKLGNWAEKILAVISTKGRAKKGSVLARLRKALPKLLLLSAFIRNFIVTTQAVASIMEILKNKGVTQETCTQCNQLIATLPEQSTVKQHLEQWLQQHLNIQKKLPDVPLLVSSDIIESLFGKFKHIIERSPQADMNRSVLLIPALCGKWDSTTIASTLNHVSHQELNAWEQANIPYTVRKKRRDFFGEKQSHNWWVV
jgi:hypothetical protein